MTPTNEIAIRLTGLSKKYRLFDNARQRLKEALDPRGRTYHQDFWALQDINLMIPKGHTVGILGRNGSGKSTLLQIVTSVLHPTAGTIEVNGRVAALLELGAGFDPEFTGRENVRQYGRIQGLAAAEIEARLPQIEQFAGIGEFFDREVKIYSSGMFARLAFAAAINVDPDILILDEILAVGDVRFQQRCYERIMRIQESGKTVLMVSHSIETIIDHCDSAILLDRGRLVMSGAPKAVADCYRELMFEETARQLGTKRSSSTQRVQRSEATTGELSPLAVEMLADEETVDRFPRRPGYNAGETQWGDDGDMLDYRIEVDGSASETNAFEAGATIRLYVLTRSPNWHAELHFGVAIRRTDGLFIYGCNTKMRPEAFRRWSSGDLVVFSSAYRLTIQGGHYFFDVGIFRDVQSETVRLRVRRNAIHLVVLSTPWFDGIADIAVIE
jgi:lipopolysaccharide transport system ATP-binding protein